ncbi:hypothetical protein [Streptomyces sp. enrichment culture]|uniref:hypothetical protein n=1 Tax=Streptomyces sp. enrichment culture TaxID=1795815 RepID=UPI003F54532B
MGGKIAGLGGDTEWWEEVLPFGTVWGSNVPSDEDFGAIIKALVVAGQYGRVQRG